VLLRVLGSLQDSIKQEIFMTNLENEKERSGELKLARLLGSHNTLERVIKLPMWLDELQKNFDVQAQRQKTYEESQESGSIGGAPDTKVRRN
jgi:hypothetical protein